MSKKILSAGSRRKLLLFLLASSFIASSGWIALIAQRRTLSEMQQQSSQFSPQLLRELKQIQQAALESDYALRQLAHLTNNIGPRLSGSPQAQHAVEYVADEMRRLGMEVKLEKIMVPHWVRGLETGALMEFPGQAPNTTQKVVLTALGGSVATPAEGITAEVVVVNNFDELAAMGRNKVEGRIVLFNYRFDEQMAAQGFGGEAYGEAVVYRGDGPSAAARLGAVAAMVRSVGGLSYRLPHTGATRYAADAPRIPAAAVAAEDADMMAYLTSQGRVRMKLTLTPQQLPDVESYNVIADLRGSEHPEQIVIVSGHLDSWDLGTGAIDDGAGVVIAMQTLQILKQLHLRPRRTIRFIAWMNEENGTAGGKTYAAEHAADVQNHIAAIESDRGAGHPLGFVATGNPNLIKVLQPLSGVLESSGGGLMNMSDDTETDISPLAKVGVPAFGIWQDTRTYFDYHHTAADTFDKVKPRELAENAAVMAVLAYAIASIPEPLPR
ncbi:MAG TPA: M20/M25/M40 family metallo-hydrolase [Pyrinomonadaceae bacterium]|nr:M20/M25/M40 family metallo-hydrolase [Pyrinomonadaceae bacterium]